MNLESWLKQDRPFQEQLRVMQGLCSALNEAHTRGTLHRGLDPSRIDVLADGTCDLSDALRAEPSAPRYRAPETLEGAAHSAQADIYTAGVIFYEMLAGRSPSAGERTTPLGDIRSDVPRDLTDAVMGCLEKGPDWRPKDLSYLLQVVRTLRASGAKVTGRPTPRGADRAAPAPAVRRPASKASPAAKSNTPLALAVIGFLALAGAGVWFWLHPFSSGTPVAARPKPTIPPSTVAAAAIPSEPVALAPAAGKPTPRIPQNEATPLPAPPALQAERPTPAPVAAGLTRPEPTRATLPPGPAPTTLEPAPTPTPTPTPATAASKAEELAAPAEPAVLATISPLTIKRPSTTIFDVHGTGLRADLKATLLKIKDAPNGISILRQKLVNSTLVQIVVKVDEGTTPGPYGLSMADSRGGFSNTLSFTVAK
jgi:Protein kinase domain